jgi:uncharacterized protein YfiM (DUF2279 family)
MHPSAATGVVFKVFLFGELAAVVDKYSSRSSGSALSTKAFLWIRQ